VNRPRFLFAFACLALAGVLLGAVVLITRASGPASASAGKSPVGGNFHLVDQNGREVDQTVLNGKWSAVFFGYTFCPEACPTNLQTLAAAQDRLGPKAANLQVVFISIDPGRDTPKVMKDYLSSKSFPKGAIGLTGTQAQVDQAAKAYKIYYQKVGTGPDYSMDHSDMIFLMNPQGEFVKVIPYALSPDQVTDLIRGAMRQDS
jgi:protein SCO1/2